MKANFRAMPGADISNSELDRRCAGLAFGLPGIEIPGSFRDEVPSGYEGHYCVDVIGDEFVWMNESFPKEKFTLFDSIKVFKVEDFMPKLKLSTPVFLP